MVLGLAVGQPIALTGERADLPASTRPRSRSSRTSCTRTAARTLISKEPLTYSYVRSSLRISANVVHATHGETVKEVLGNGDALAPTRASR